MSSLEPNGSDQTADVIIVGGGPAGLMLAIELGRRNIDVALFDDETPVTPNPQANATQARTMEHFRRMGFADEVRALGLPPDHPTDIVYFTTYAGHELARVELPTARQATELAKSLTGAWSAAELPHRVSQKFVEQVLYDHAKALPSVTLNYEQAVVAVDDAGDHVTATVERQGRQRTVQAQYLVGCDGSSSLVRRHLAIRYQGEAGVQRNFAGGHMHAVYLKSDEIAAAMPGPPGWMHVNVHHTRRSFMITLDGKGEFVFHTQLHPEEDRDRVTDEQARAMFRQCMGADVSIEILSRASWTAGFALVAEQFQHGRLFIAGDAAHLFTPMGGLGYNTAIEDSVNLGWKLAAVLNGWGGPELLDSYHLERHPAAVRNTGYAREFAESLGGYVPDPRLEEDSAAGQALRAEAGRYFDNHGRKEFNIPGITFGTRIDGSPIIVPDGTAPPVDLPNEYVPTACPGGRTPHAWLADGQSLFDRFGFEFSLLNFTEDADAGGALQDAAERAGVPLQQVHLPDPSLRDLYAAAFALVRPDQTVAWRGDRVADPQTLLARVTGHPT